MGQGQDRHMYALHSLIQQEMAQEGSEVTVPAIFKDPGYNTLGTSVLSTSNCGNPALRVSLTSISHCIAPLLTLTCNASSSSGLGQ